MEKEEISVVERTNRTYARLFLALMILFLLGLLAFIFAVFQGPI